MRTARVDCYAASSPGEISPDVAERLADALAAVDHARDRVVHLEAALDDVLEQVRTDASVLRRTDPEAEWIFTPFTVTPSATTTVCSPTFRPSSRPNRSLPCVVGPSSGPSKASPRLLRKRAPAATVRDVARRLGVGQTADPRRGAGVMPARPSSGTFHPVGASAGASTKCCTLALAMREGSAAAPGGRTAFRLRRAPPASGRRRLPMVPDTVSPG
jgi:hypothetical protein